METAALDLVEVFAFAGLLTVLLTPTVGGLALWRYRVVVQREMRRLGRRGAQPLDARSGAVPPPPRTAHVPPPPSIGPPPPPPPPPIEVVDLARRGPTPTTGRTDVVGIRRTAGVHTVAGLVFAVILASAWLAQAGEWFHPRTFVIMCWIYAWLVVPTVLEMVGADARTRIKVWFGYFAVAVLIPIGSSASAVDLLVLLSVMIGPPALVLFALGGRRMRAVGPFLAPPVLVISVALVAWPWAALALVEGGVSLAVALIGIVVTTSAVVASTFLYLGRVTRRYRTKRVSDQMLHVRHAFLLVTMWWALEIAVRDPLWAVVPLVGYAVFRTIVAVGFASTDRPTGEPVRLLLLRTFGARGRSESLLRLLGARWRHRGSVHLIAGPDLATATLEPDDFLTFLSGRLRQRFIADERELEAHLACIDLAPDPDGRYRTDDLFCHDDTWRPAVRGLATTCDVVLMDLRGFSAENLGVRFELEALVELVPLRRVVALIDTITDVDGAVAVVGAACHRAGPGSPNHRARGGRLSLARVGAGAPPVTPLLDLLLQAATRPSVASRMVAGYR